MVFPVLVGGGRGIFPGSGQKSTFTLVESETVLPTSWRLPTGAPRDRAVKRTRYRRPSPPTPDATPSEAASTGRVPGSSSGPVPRVGAWRPAG
jgi:hypothetical protein